MSGRRGIFGMGLLGGLILVLIFYGGFVVGITFDRHQNSAAFDSSDPNLRDFLAAYRLVTQQSYYRPFNKHQLVYAAIDGMLGATGDPHTVFLAPTDNKTADQQLNGESFSGIGAIVLPEHAYLEVLAPVPNAPAAQAGVRAGDRIIRIDGKGVAGLSGTTAIDRIHGRTGSTVSLTIVRGHGSPFTVQVHRRPIAPITAYSRTLPQHLGYLQIFSFGQDTSDQVAQSLATLARAGVRGIILDLRGNPGGYVDAAQGIVSQFIPRGVVAYEKRTDKSLSPLAVIAGKRTVHVPVAVLVDDQTASAAEITAAALRDEAGAPLIGTRTYGKGSMQSVYSLADGSTVRITDRLWLTPNKKSISQIGLRPTVYVGPTLPGKSTTGDPQLAAAEQYLHHHTL